MPRHKDGVSFSFFLFFEVHLSADAGCVYVARVSFLAPTRLQLIRVLFDAAKVEVDGMQYIDPKRLARRHRPFKEAEVSCAASHLW